MPREGSPRSTLAEREREREKEMEMIEGEKRKSGRPEERRREPSESKGAAIEPRRPFHTELIIVVADEKRRPYYSPVHNKNS